MARRGEVFQIAQIQTELYFVLCRITIFCAQQRIQQRIMGVDYRRSAGAVTPATGKKPPALRLGETLNRPRLLPRYCFPYGDTRELNKASLGLCLRCYSPPLCSTPATGKNPPALRLRKILNRPQLLPRYCFLYGDTRELNKAPPGLCLRCFHRRSVRPPPPAKNPQPCGWGFLCRWWGSNPHGITTNGF